MLGKGFNYNFGANLQAYALQHVVSSLGDYCEIIDYVPPHGLFKAFQRNLQYKGIRYAVSRVISIRLEEFNKKIIIKKKDADAMIQGSNNFRGQHLNFSSKTFQGFNDLSDHSKYDVYIAGSDLIWAPWFNDWETLRVYLLGFVKEGRRVSYGAVVGKWIPRWARPIFREYLEKFYLVSVRDEMSAKALREFTQDDIEVVLDPVALLRKKEWFNLLGPPRKEPKKPYVLVYDICRFKDIQREMKHVARKKGWNLVTYIPSKDSFSFYSFDPLEFLWLYQNADFAVSSSFHGTVFSVLFNRPFYAVDPSPIASEFRIRDFLEKLNLRDRFVEPKKLRLMKFDEPDWSLANSCLENERQRSLNFLKRALRGVEE